jgi:prepilin-type N-terminal cleavage/methylation domain-containing protein
MNLQPKHRGFTLIELVVTIAILSVVAVILIPSVRTLNQDRKVRDTARIVGSMFAAARERAAVDGAAGVEIVPLANASGAYNIPNMGMVLYQLRAIPPWSGDYADSTATVVVAGLTGTATLSDPSDMTASGANIRADDFIEFNHSGVLYRITSIDTAAGTVDFEIGAHDPPPPETVELVYRIYRQPVRIESSVLRLPNNLFLNLALSGHGTTSDPLPPSETNEWLGFQFRFDPAQFPVADVGAKVWFNRDGSIDKVTTRREELPGPLYSSQMEAPEGPVYLLMANGDDDDIDVTQLDGSNWIADDNNLWIVIDDRNGSVSIGKVAEFLPADAYRTQIQKSRDLARSRRTANP